MKSQREIEALSNQALNSLDNLQPAEANAFLYSKIRNRMVTNRQQSAAQNARLMFRLSAALLLFVGINVASFYALNRPQAAGNKPVAAKSATNAFSDEFLPKDNFYNY